MHLEDGPSLSVDLQLRGLLELQVLFPPVDVCGDGVQLPCVHHDGLCQPGY